VSLGGPSGGPPTPSSHTRPPWLVRALAAQASCSGFEGTPGELLQGAAARRSTRPGYRAVVRRPRATQHSTAQHTHVSRPTLEVGLEQLCPHGVARERVLQWRSVRRQQQSTQEWAHGSAAACNRNTASAMQQAKERGSVRERGPPASTCAKVWCGCGRHTERLSRRSAQSRTVVGWSPTGADDAAAGQPHPHARARLHECSRVLDAEEAAQPRVHFVRSVVDARHCTQASTR
jgi:hypothetical protein